MVIIESGWTWKFTVKLLEASLYMIHLFLVCEFEFWSFAGARDPLECSLLHRRSG